ncbi:argininosuccinate synthase domain-containing protein [Saccharopolyspora taberi]|uniref:argininosuccinate synthase n=1 Tax=Saccharopolyspora taberi TaxID=60895 RepID=A0ABN3VIA2_9PSEU
MAERVVFACTAGIQPWPGSVAAIVDVGQGEDVEGERSRALECGAAEAVVVDARDEFAERYYLPAVQAGALHAGPLVPALSRLLIAEHLAAAARTRGATTVVHGWSDRFTAVIAALAPDLEVLARAARPIDRRVHVPDPGDPDELMITFDRGVPVAIDGETVTVLQAVRELNRRSGGRHRAIFEAPGARTLSTAHRELADNTLDPDLARFGRTVGRRWRELVHDGRWSAPLKTALDAFVADTQQHVTGEIRVLLNGEHGARCA